LEFVEKRSQRKGEINKGEEGQLGHKTRNGQSVGGEKEKGNKTRFLHNRGDTGREILRRGVNSRRREWVEEKKKLGGGVPRQKRTLREKRPGSGSERGGVLATN